ncbi:TPA: hypothetical protein ACH3X1_000911 [Trebouxia sp. C0004]
MAPVAYTSVSHVICHSKNPTQSCPRSVVQGRDHSVHSCSRTRQMAYRSKLPCSMQPHLCEAVLLAFIASGNHNAAFAAESQGYVPSPVTVGWEIYAGAIAGVIPFAIGSYQFIARILIQRRCEKCDGSGLVERGPLLRKCPECGGFFPWQGWKQFFTSTAAPGNGGVLRQPRNQEGVIYRIPPKAKDEACDWGQKKAKDEKTE